MADPVPAVAAQRLRKSYGNVLAVADIDMTVSPGEVFGLLGPNGAGKTTLVKILVGLARADAGAAAIFGLPAGSLGAKRRLGFLPELFRFHDWMTATEFLEFHGRLAGLKRSEAAGRARLLLEKVGMAARADSRLAAFSKGMLQRMGIAQALMGRPDIVFLDEPTSALDPIGRRDVRDLIRELKTEGVTVFLNSHLLSEIETVCDRVAILNRGVVVAEGDLDSLLSARTLMVKVGSFDAERLRSAVEDFGLASAQNGELLFNLVSEDRIPEVVRRLVNAGIDVHRVTLRADSLEDLFVRVVEAVEK